MFTAREPFAKRQRLPAALVAAVAAFGLSAATASAGTTGPVDQGATECPVYSSTDPACTLPPPSGGVGIPCLDARLPCDLGGGGIGGGGGGGAAPATPRVSVGNASVTEGDSGTSLARFTVSLSSASTSTITVDYSTADGTARAPVDYTRQTGTLTFSPGRTSQSVSVPVVGETEDERAEHFVLQIFNATSNASIGDREGRGDITDNDLWVKVWANAFIPRDIDGLTRIVPAGPHAGKTMIPTLSAPCALTDQRHLDGSPAASHRMQSLAVIDPKKGIVVDQVHGSDKTIEVDCQTGEEVCSTRAEPAGIYHHVLDPDGIRLDLQAGQSNPCVTGSPQLEYEGTVRITRGGAPVTVSFEGLVEPFPAFEMYAAGFHSPLGFRLFQRFPTGGLTDLFGSPNKPVSGVTVLSSTDA